ncbi:MAG: glutathione S-transferase [Proteobacteria bacterium]|nr:MAG: glutathione S-transferase [Pseudomonadota bacterium]
MRPLASGVGLAQCVAMTDLILHHYEMSPYAEKIRLALGRKRLAWRSVQTPMVMPKPDHLELTGGYRRVPVLQIGADVYCDTHCIARALDRVAPDPLLAPLEIATQAHAVSRWAETTFMMAVLALFGIGGVFPEEFVEDRRKTMVPPGMDLDRTPMILPAKLLQIRANLDRLERLLADGRRFLLGAEPTLADLSAFHPLLLLGMHERTAALLTPLRHLPAWTERVRAIGHGTRSELASADAIAIARDASPARYDGEPVLPDGMALGDPVVVLADEYGSGVVAGKLAASDLHEIAVRRETPRAGEVVVHFPREEYAVVRAG